MTTIKLKNGSGAPTAGDLVQGEPALDLTNKRLYTEDSGGTVIEVGTNPGTDVTFADNRKALFGTGSDLQIYHDGTNSYIVNTTNDLIIGEDTRVRIKTPSLLVNNAADNENLLTATENGAVTLYYDNAAKIATTSTGIDVTGTALAHKIEIGDGSGGGTSEILFSDNVSARGKILYDHSSNPETMLLQTTGTTAISIDNSQNVSMPNGNLDVTGNLTVDAGSNGKIDFGNVTTNYGRLYADSTGTFVGSVTADPLIFRTTNTERMRIDSSGRVGIGESNPATDLHITNSGSTQLLLESGSSSQGILLFGDASDLNIGSVVYDHSNNSMSFETDDTVRMTINSSGNVGIGTASPAAALDVTNGHIKLSAGYSLQWDDSHERIEQSNGNLEFFTNNSQQMTISGSNVGIGDSNPARKLTVQGGSGDTLPIRVVGGSGTATGGIEFQDASTTADYKVQIGSIGDNLYLRAGGAERMRIDSSGNVQIGTAAVTGGRYFDIYNTGSTATDFAITRFITQQVGSSSTTSADVYKRKNGEFGFANNDTDSAAYINFKVGTSNRMRLTSSGDLLVGTTSTPTGSTGGSAFITESVGRKTLKIASTTTSGAGLAEFINPNGVVGTIVTNGSATAYNTSSDQRLKENIVDAPSASDDIDAIQVRSFDWKADGSHQKYGMVAQELQTVAPEAVTEGETEEDMMGVDYSKLVPMLVKEIQSLRARVAQLEND